jgi:transcriptional regulator with XRE-family HTH domain
VPVGLEYAPGVSTLSRWERGKNGGAEKDPLAIIALADLYGCKVSDLSPEVSDQLEAFRDLLIHASGWLTASLAA